MRNSLIITALLLSALFVNAQTPGQKAKNLDSIFNAGVAVQAHYPEGLQAFYNFIAQNITYPESAAKEHIQGKVFVAFLVLPDGNLTDIKVVKGISPEIDTEAVHVIKASPKWIPGTFNGRAVRQQFTVPINFALKVKQ